MQSSTVEKWTNFLVSLIEKVKHIKVKHATNERKGTLVYGRNRCDVKELP